MSVNSSNGGNNNNYNNHRRRRHHRHQYHRNIKENFYWTNYCLCTIFNKNTIESRRQPARAPHRRRRRRCRQCQCRRSRWNRTLEEWEKWQVNKCILIPNYVHPTPRLHTNELLAIGLFILLDFNIRSCLKINIFSFSNESTLSHSHSLTQIHNDNDNNE